MEQGRAAYELNRGALIDIFWMGTSIDREQQLAGKRCDYFPRGYFEVDPELKSFGQRYPRLQHHNSLILYYLYAIYFFVSHKNEALAQWIEQGLEKMIDDGELLAHMKRYPLTSHVFPLQNAFAPWNIIQIPNPSLSADTDTTNPRYWFQPSDFE